MHIRCYQPEDESAVIDLWLKCNLVVPWNNPQRDIERKLKVNPELFLVGLLDGRIVASVMGGYEGHRGWINYLAVDPDCRRRGLGREIMAAVEKKIHDLGADKINLQVRMSNPEAVRFYEAIGYQVEELVNMGKRLEEAPPYDQSQPGQAYPGIESRHNIQWRLCV